MELFAGCGSASAALRQASSAISVFFERVTDHASCVSETSGIFCHGMKATFEFVSGMHEGYLPGRGL